MKKLKLINCYKNSPEEENQEPKNLDEMKTIDKTLKYILEQTGLNLLPCEYFKGIKDLAGKKYFNVVLNERTSESKDFDILEKFSNKYKTIIIEPNGLKRVAVFLNGIPSSQEFQIYKNSKKRTHGNGNYNLRKEI